ncbi:hypothetical protein L3i20_v243480 [Paenibacillus sp. L3-i20]|nr:hypothetical protein L3i20_v243480 [Paenibacillus sp. L3-i20]
MLLLSNSIVKEHSRHVWAVFVEKTIIERLHAPFYHPIADYPCFLTIIVKFTNKDFIDLHLLSEENKGLD